MIYARVLFWAVCFLAGVLVTANFGLHIFLAILSMGGLIFSFTQRFWYYIWNLWEIRMAFKQRENVYVYSRYPGDPTVHQRAEKALRLLRDSGNPLMQNKRTAVIVHKLYYQDSSRPNETWDEFEQWRDDFIAKDRLLRMRILGEDRTWFEKFILNQDGITYE